MWVYKEKIFEGLKLNPKLISFYYLGTNSSSDLKG